VTSAVPRLPHSLRGAAGSLDVPPPPAIHPSITAATTTTTQLPTTIPFARPPPAHIPTPHSPTPSPHLPFRPLTSPAPWCAFAALLLRLLPRRCRPPSTWFDCAKPQIHASKLPYFHRSLTAGFLCSVAVFSSSLLPSINLRLVSFASRPVGTLTGSATKPRVSPTVRCRTAFTPLPASNAQCLTLNISSHVGRKRIVQLPAHARTR
jgi:hypothetical protein